MSKATKKKVSEPKEVLKEDVQESSAVPSASPQPTQVLSQQDTQVSDLVRESPKQYRNCVV